MNHIVYVGKHALTIEVSYHVHASWELIFCTSGECNLTYNGKTLHYGTNDIAVIPPMLPHAHVSKEGFTNIHINMEDTAFTNHEPEIIPCDPNGFLLTLFTAAHYYYSINSSARVALLPGYGQLIADTLSCYQPENAHSDLVQQIKDNILQNCSDCNYDLNEYLHSLPFSFEYLKKLFKKEVGLTPLQYLTDKRLEDAAGNLATSYNKGNISEMSHLCGFSDPLYFSRLFKKKYGVSPRNYVAQNISPAITDSDSMKIML